MPAEKALLSASSGDGRYPAFRDAAWRPGQLSGIHTVEPIRTDALLLGPTLTDPVDSFHRCTDSL